MEKNWKVEVKQNRRYVYSDGVETWFREEFELHCADPAEAWEIIKALESAWPSDFPPMQIKITNIIPAKEQSDKIPDTDFMEGGAS